MDVWSVGVLIFELLSGKDPFSAPASIKNQTTNVLNFGCCYYRLRDLKDRHYSNFAKENGIELSEFALTLATRPPGIIKEVASQRPRA